MSQINDSDSNGQPKSPRRRGRRKHGHDYCAPWKYHITISKAQGSPDFSSIDVRNMATMEVGLDYSALGKIIWRQIKAIQNDSIRIYRHSIMPDHIHLLVHVKERIPRHLGYYIAEFKSQITAEWRRITADDEIDIFEGNYHDRIILPEHNLNDIYQYIKSNPYRLAVRRIRPDFFQKERLITAGGREVQAYGNLFHYRNPFKHALIVHRSDDETIFKRKLEECLYFAENGGVVVSAFISQREKEIRKEIEAVGGKIILIQDRPFSWKEKPARHDFELCCNGSLLILSPMDYLDLPKSEHPPRQQCLDMNRLAEKIAAQKP